MLIEVTAGSEQIVIVADCRAWWRAEGTNSGESSGVEVACAGVRLYGVIGAVTPLRAGIFAGGRRQNARTRLRRRECKAVAMVINSPAVAVIASDLFAHQANRAEKNLACNGICRGRAASAAT